VVVWATQLLGEKKSEYWATKFWVRVMVSVRFRNRYFCGPVDCCPLGSSRRWRFMLMIGNQWRTIIWVWN